MFTGRLSKVLIVLALAVVFLFTVQMASTASKPYHLPPRYNPAAHTQATSAESNFPNGKFIKSGTTDYGFIFNEDGTYSRFEYNVTVTRGTYSVDGDVFTETSNDGSCASNISHTFTFDGRNLTFNYVGNPQDDTCGGRRADFNNVTYVLSK